MAMCHVCRRNMLTGERYRLWTQRNGVGERPVCRLCEEEADQAGWVRLDQPLQRELGAAIWHARKVA
jgi:hypothetical protein